MRENRPDFNNITFGEWLSFWYDTYKKPYLSANSLRNIDQMLRLHTPQWLKDIPIKELTVFDIDSALSKFASSRTSVYVRQVWHSAFVRALKLGVVDKNIVELSDSIRYKKKRGNALTIAEQTLFIKQIEKSRVKWLMLFYLCTGVRRSEATALEWSDIDEEQGLILIRGTKTDGSFRHILLTDEVKSILNGQKRQIVKDKNTRYKSVHPEKVFDYTPSYVSQAFKKLCPNHHLHDLRHTYVTRCAECGMNINVCQQLVGHSTPQLTMSIYTHVFDDFKRKEALKLQIKIDV
jgi:integrase